MDKEDIRTKNLEKKITILKKKTWFKKELHISLIPHKMLL